MRRSAGRKNPSVVGANVKTDQRSVPSDQTIGIAIVGAGPYGLSIAAHLNARDIPFRIFGRPGSSVWATGMPRGMRLKSEGFASSLSDPESQFTLGGLPPGGNSVHRRRRPGSTRDLCRVWSGISKAVRAQSRGSAGDIAASRGRRI